MTDLSTSDAVTSYRTLINGGLDAYKVLAERGSDFSNGSTAGTYQLGPDGFTVTSGSATSDGITPFYFDPARYAVTGRTTKLNLHGLAICTTNAPGMNFTLGLYPVTIAGTTAFTFTLGTVVSGSTAAINAPAASTGTAASSGDFTAPAAGLFALGVVLSGTPAASTKIRVLGRLELRTA